MPTYTLPARGAARRTGFTLTELLVVLGIILIVLALVVPAVGKAWGSARKVECLSNVRHLTAAAVAYAGDNNHYLPDAGSGNYETYAPLSPLTFGQPPWTQISTGVNPYYVLPSAGGALRKYLGDDAAGFWKCPSAPTDGSIEAFHFMGDNPYNGTQRGRDRFWPNYSYMAGKEWFFQRNSTFAGDYRMKDWVSRNVSGLNVNRISGSQPSSGVVIFYERQSTYHSKTRTNIYLAREPGDYYATFGFLDGHAEGKSYKNADGYIGALHRPIRQTWFGADFAAEMPEQYLNVP
jgi:prepilin-type N-terminal cleavage/methylation domain-containing protein